MINLTSWELDTSFHSNVTNLARPLVAYTIDTEKVYMTFDNLSSQGNPGENPGINELENNIPEGFVDLGLPSGTLWSTKNLGATNSETAESWYGDCYAWGEIETKDSYSWDNYKHAETTLDEHKLTKYCNDSEYGKDGYTDSLTTLVSEDDAAYVASNGIWRMPTVDQFEELLEYTDKTEILETNYHNITGLNGFIFTKRNDSTVSIFFPAAGFYHSTSFRNVGSRGRYWASNLIGNLPDSALYLDLQKNLIVLSAGPRSDGQFIRPIIAIS